MRLQPPRKALRLDGRTLSVAVACLVAALGATVIVVNRRLLGGLGAPAPTAAHTRCEPAVNLLEGQPVQHHAVMCAMPADAVRFDGTHVVERGPLWVPARYDCTNLGGVFWGVYEYYGAVPSRWVACERHAADLRAGVPWVVPRLPVVDDEYFEHVAVYDAARRAARAQPPRRFVAAELGARWGTWGFRAIAALRAASPAALPPHRLWLVEANLEQCGGIGAVAARNNISVETHCGKATAAGLAEWLRSEPTVDLVDLDIQGAELNILSDREVRAELDARVRRLIIGTHSVAIHTQLRAAYAHWHTQIDVEHAKDPGCVDRWMRSPNKADRRKYAKLVQAGCYRDSAFGKIANIDGELILDNPKFYEAPPLFPDEFKPATDAK